MSPARIRSVSEGVVVSRSQAVEETPAAEAYEVVRTGAVRAQRLARELRPAVILLDYAMPDMDDADVTPCAPQGPRDGQTDSAHRAASCGRGPGQRGYATLVVLHA
jgi:CheY-like chemotaxis protein